MKNRAIQIHSLTLACVKHVGIAGSGVDGFIHDKRTDFRIYFEKLNKIKKLKREQKAMQFGLVFY